MACCFTLKQNEQGVVTTCTSRRLVDGPVVIGCIMPWESITVHENCNLDSNQMVKKINHLNPEKSRFVRGPLLAKLDDPWEIMEKINCVSLDQDDYLIVKNESGDRKVIRGPKVYAPDQFGEEIVNRHEAIQVPVNHYIIVHDADSANYPVQHLKGPMKWYPEPFQTKAANNTGYFRKDCFPCIEVTKARAVHLQRQDGSVVLVEEVGYFMPLPGEKVLDTVPRQVLNPTDFCIIKSPNGQIYCRSGKNATDRGFFLKPFEEFLTFETFSEIKCVLNQQDQYLPHEFLVRTSDQVIITLECRIQYKISDVEKFADQPIQFFEYLKASVQNNLLDRFAQSSLREFNERFGKIAKDTLPGTQEYFMQFGIDVIEIMILAHSCVNKKTNELLKDDIKLNIGKQNELRAAQNDVLIQEQANEVRRKQKDLEVTMSMKDNEVAMQEKIMQNTLRIKEMDIELAEELKRTELLEVKRTNDLVEAEFEGRAKGHELKEYFRGVGENLTSKEKIDMYDRKCRLETTKLLYAKADKITLYPNGVDVKTFQLDNEEDATLLRASMISSIGLHHGIDKPGSSISVNAV